MKSVIDRLDLTTEILSLIKAKELIELEKNESKRKKTKLKGVKKPENVVAKAVKLTDNAAFPFAILLKKLETFPPGQAAIIIIPKAKLG